MPPTALSPRLRLAQLNLMIATRALLRSQIRLSRYLAAHKVN